MITISMVSDNNAVPAVVLRALNHYFFFVAQSHCCSVTDFQLGLL